MCLMVVYVSQIPRTVPPPAKTPSLLKSPEKNIVNLQPESKSNDQRGDTVQNSTRLQVEPLPKTNFFLPSYFVHNYSYYYQAFNQLATNGGAVGGGVKSSCLAFNPESVKLSGPFETNQQYLYTFIIKADDEDEPFSDYYRHIEGRITREDDTGSIGLAQVVFFPITEGTLMENYTPLKLVKRRYVGQFYLPLSGLFYIDLRIMDPCLSISSFTGEKTSMKNKLFSTSFQLEKGTLESNINALKSIYLENSKKDVSSGLWVPLVDGKCDGIVCTSAPNTTVTKMLGKFVFANFENPTYIFNTNELLECLRGKTLGFFGDSTVDEFLEFMIKLMKEFDSETIHKKADPMKRHISRNSIVENKAFNIKIRNRGIHNVDTDTDFGGVVAILGNANARQEVYNAATQSDLVIITSAFHDVVKYSNEHPAPRNLDGLIEHCLTNVYEPLFQETLTWKQVNPKLKIIWKGIVPASRTGNGDGIIYYKINQIVKELLSKKYTHIINVESSLVAIPNCYPGKLSDGIHFGEHNYGTKNNDHQVLNMIAHLMFNAMCGRPSNNK